jgi:drug/metabolite transporter (DMT)-like permease
LENPYSWQQQDFAWLALLGLGPLGIAFYLWDAALKLGNPIRIGIISFLTPLLSTLGVLLVQERPVTPAIAVAALLIIGSGAIGLAARPSKTTRGLAA